MELSPILQGTALVVVLGLPLLSADDRAVTEELDAIPDRRSVYLSGGLALVVLAGIVWAIAVWQEVDATALGWRDLRPLPVLAWGGATAAAGLALVAVFTRWLRALGFRESPLALFLLPRNRRERRAFLLLVVVAGVCEEYVYRGFALHVLGAWGGSLWVAAAVTAVSFGLAHGYQRIGGILRAALLGGLLAVPVIRTGSLGPAIVAHIGINSVIGLGGWRWLAPGGAEPGEAEPREPEESESAGVQRDGVRGGDRDDGG